VSGNKEYFLNTMSKINKIIDNITIGLLLFIYSIFVLTYIGLFIFIGKVIYDVILWAI
jgi:hypothetical protein